MSNLFKPWSVQTLESSARVIDSNGRMLEYLKRSAAQQTKQPEDTPEGEAAAFAGGILPEEASNIIKAEPDVDYVALAKEEAERILSDAQEKAGAIVGQANDEADRVQEEARSKGYAEGRTQLEQEFAAQRAQLEAEYRKKEEALETEYRGRQRQMERELVDALMPVFDKVFRIQFEDKREILLSLVDHAVLNIEGEKRFRIRVAEERVAFLEDCRGELLNHVGHDIELEILGDPGMKANDCMIETDSGVFDCGLDTQLDNLKKDIRSLCS